VITNAAEAAFRGWAQAKGWHATKSGYPDFICVTESGEVSLVEVKPRRSTPLDVAQIKAMRLLLEYGVPCFRWSPDDAQLQRMTFQNLAVERISALLVEAEPAPVVPGPGASNGTPRTKPWPSTPVELGRRGGRSRAARLSPEERSAAASKAAKARWRHDAPA
jgi:hypothetical protein